MAGPGMFSNDFLKNLSKFTESKITPTAGVRDGSHLVEQRLTGRKPRETDPDKIKHRNAVRQAARGDLASIARRRAEEPPWMKGEMEPPGGDQLVDGDLVPAYTKEQQERLGVNADGYRVRPPGMPDALYGLPDAIYGGMAPPPGAPGGGPALYRAPHEYRTPQTKRLRADDAAALPPPGVLTFGARVKAHSLMSIPELNGQEGTITARKADRWTVKFDDEKLGEKALKPCNLTVQSLAGALVPQTALPLQQPVKLDPWGKNPHLLGRPAPSAPAPIVPKVVTADDILACDDFDEALRQHTKTMELVMKEGPPADMFRKNWSPGAQFHFSLRNRIKEAIAHLAAEEKEKHA